MCERDRLLAEIDKRLSAFAATKARAATEQERDIAGFEIHLLTWVRERIDAGRNASEMALCMAAAIGGVAGEIVARDAAPGQAFANVQSLVNAFARCALAEALPALAEVQEVLMAALLTDNPSARRH